MKWMSPGANVPLHQTAREMRRSSLQSNSTQHHSTFQLDNPARFQRYRHTVLNISNYGSNDLGIHVVERSNDKQCLQIEITISLTVCCSSQRIFCLGSVHTGWTDPHHDYKSATKTTGPDSIPAPSVVGWRTSQYMPYYKEAELGNKKLITSNIDIHFFDHTRHPYDFNVHHPSWYSRTTYTRGSNVADPINGCDYPQLVHPHESPAKHRSDLAICFNSISIPYHLMLLADPANP